MNKPLPVIIFFSFSIFLLFTSATQADITPSLRNFSPDARRTDIRTVCILGLRVSFRADKDEATTGDGSFLETAALPCANDYAFRMIDPPPHNNAYFLDHIKALSNYYRHASRGNLCIDTLKSEVFPLDSSKTYQVSRSMAYYHPFLKEDSIDIRLAELFTEAVNLADADPDVDFAEYDLVVLFHAGVGQDFDLFLDPTPHDIPSAYLNRNDLALASKDDPAGFNGIAVDDGTKWIDRGIILPETQNHLLYPNWEEVFGGAQHPCDYQIGLNGTFTFMMGFYLGLPGLYNTETGATGIGKFGLMDQGSANLNGLIPALPSAWERSYMEWDRPVLAGASQEVELDHAESGADTTIWKIPINGREYFLIENRYSDVRPGVTLDSMQYKYWEDHNLSDDEYPPLLPFITDSTDARFSDITGVLLSVPRYDIGLPGAGLLIWHIDEAVIAANIGANRVNNDRTRPGVDLEEGDGAQDLGYESQIIGANVDIGWYFDPWFAGNEGFWHLNPDYPQDSLKRVAFTEATNPSSSSNDNAYTGIRIDRIGLQGARMPFRIQLGADLPNYPVELPETGSALSMPVPIDLDTTDNWMEYIVIGKNLYLIRSNGELLSNIPLEDAGAISIPAAIRQGDTYHLFFISNSLDSPVINCWIVNAAGNFVFKDTLHIGNYTAGDHIVPFKGSLLLSLESGDSQNFLGIYDPDEGTLDRYAVKVPIRQFLTDGSRAYMFQEGVGLSRIEIEDVSGEFSAISVIENDLNPTSGIVGGYLNPNEYLDFAFVADDQIHLYSDPESESAGVYHFSLTAGTYNLAVTDLQGDGNNELIAAGPREIYAFNGQLVLEENFPVGVPNLYAGRDFSAYLLCADTDGDGGPDILTSIDNIGLAAYNRRGRLNSGFPRASVAFQSRSAILLNSAGQLVLVAQAEGESSGAESKFVAKLVGEGAAEGEDWIAYGSNSYRGFIATKPAEALSTAPSSLLDHKKTFNWPNPTKNDQTAIRYFPNRSCAISVDIYDIAGDFITSFSNASPQVQEYNEIVWNVRNIANGVYLAMVTASAGGQTDRKIVKIMVIH